jgi:carboxynorspermidine decarboxylase
LARHSELIINVDWGSVKTPTYILDEDKIEKNLMIFDDVQKRTGCKMILALKAFSNFVTFPLFKQYLSGTAASSLYEARLAHDQFGGEAHIYSPAFKQEQFSDICTYASTIIFNSFSQWQFFKAQVPASIRCGLRLNPEHCEVDYPLYNPCAQYSRFGVTKREFKPDCIEGLSGFLIHSLCGNLHDALERTLMIFESNFGDYLHQMEWLDLGGGHVLTDERYDIDHLCRQIDRLQSKYKLQVIFEPGEAFVKDAGYLVCEVLDIVHNERDIAIVDTSATAHMPDVLEMPYRPDIMGAGLSNEKQYTYRIGGGTCLSGDIIGDYSFDQPLLVGDKLVFTDMAQYTMVKNTLFNGIQLPSIMYLRKNGDLEMVKSFGYETFKERLS